MLGLFALAGWTFVGLLVSAVKKSFRPLRTGDAAAVTLICVTGAIAGGLIARLFGLNAFGPGLLFAAAGAWLLLFLYESRERSAADPRIDSFTPATPRPATPEPKLRLVERIGLAIGFGGLGGFAAAIGGLLGDYAGIGLYPQQYEQIPSEFFLIPLGVILGFVTVATAGLTLRRWSAAVMLTVTAVAGIAYAGIMFEFRRAHARHAVLTVTVEPNPSTAVWCEPGTCPETDPPVTWRVEGQLRVQERAGLGGTIEGIEISSSEEWPRRRGPHRVTREEAAERNRFSGPYIRLKGTQITGRRHIRPDEIAAYPIRYSYRTRNGQSTRTIFVHVQFSDRAGHGAVGVAEWKVQ